MIEMTRNVANVKKFAMDVKKEGAIQIGLKLGILFLSSGRSVTGSVDEIPDSEIKENFTKFVKAS